MRTSDSKRRMPNWAIGLVLLLVIGVGSVFAYTKKLPWSDPYEVQAVFETAQNLRPKAPVRIAGVNIGEVTKIEPLTSDSPELTAQAGGSQQAPADEDGAESAALVTMSLTEEALPLHEDTQFQLRPRLFLEGNLFIDAKPGSPNAEEVGENHTFPVNQTSNSVQIDQVLTTLQSDVRANLQVFLDQFGNALMKYGGAKGFQELYGSSAGAFKFTSQVNEALQGKRVHDLSGLIGNLDKVVRALGSNELALQNLITNFRVVTGSFAAEAASLEQAIAKLPDVLDAAEPAFANLNASFPPLRAFAREALPGVRSTAPALRAATPFINQLRLLVSEPELRGLVADLRPTIPDLARLSERTKPLLGQFRRLASCFNEAVIPWSNDTVDPPASYPAKLQPQGNVAEETASGLVGIASESRSGDANGQYIRVEAGSGANTILIPGGAPDGASDAVGLLDFPLLGGMPSVHGNLADSVRPKFRPRVKCETQDPPDLSAAGVTSGDAGVTTPPNPVGLDDLIQTIQDIIGLLPRRQAAALQKQSDAYTAAEQEGDAEALAEAGADIQRTLERLGADLGGTAAAATSGALGSAPEVGG
ncbi:MAG: MlaD family protein [Solirubrobacterales bacterium]